MRRSNCANSVSSTDGMRPVNFNFKRFADPVHQSIGLSKLEVEVVATKAFQRLRGVKQLGLAPLVFPGADYSRFSHSLGVCHITGKILNALQNNSGISIAPKEIQMYRLAALLHDIGHYPFSHTMEDAGGQFYSDHKLEDGVEVGPSAFWGHESVGKHVVRVAPELRDLLAGEDYDPKDVTDIFTREHPPRFGNLVSSDLDADRIDYLLRTAHHTGLPYGSVDIDYLLSQMQVDDDGLICLPAKAMRAAEHFLLCRYFDYQQVSYHKTVAGLERVLVCVISTLLRDRAIMCSQDDIQNMITDGRWHTFDDAFLVGHMRTLAGSSDPVVAAQVRAILERNPPRLVFEEEQIVDRKGSDALKHMKKRVEGQIDSWADEFHIDRSLWYPWERKQTITKIGSHVPIPDRLSGESDGTGEDDTDEDVAQAIRVQVGDGRASKPIMKHGNSLMNVLSNYELVAYRLYVLLPEGQDGLRRPIQDKIKKFLA